jgi:outer membrane immunogenic protein
MITVYVRRLGCFLAALLLGAAVGYGQGPGKYEVAAGYTFVDANAPPGQCGCFTMNGLSGQFAARLGHGFSLVGDLGADHQGNVDSSGQSLWLVNYLFGPRISYRKSKRVTPFAQFLLGGAHATGSLYGTAATSSSAATSGSAGGFAFSTGGGLDYNLTKHFAIRLFQLEYFNTRLPNSVNGFQNNLRLTAGVVFRFGKK